MALGSDVSIETVKAAAAARILVIKFPASTPPALTIHQSKDSAARSSHGQQAGLDDR
jgi:hypothetical protein